MKKLSDFCYTEDNSLSSDVCDALIKMYNDHQELHERYDADKKPNFTQFNFTENQNLNSELHKHLVNVSVNAIQNYRKMVKETILWPQKIKFEYFRMKHYKARTEDQFDIHIDANDKENSVRFLAFFWYLNDVAEGGETEFVNFDLTIKPKKGRLFMFPPLWLYPHRGNIAISNDKFLLSSYLHFA